MLNKNEICLLKFMSNPIDGNNNIVDVALNLGIKINFKDNNPVYQIIDELNFSDYVKLRKINEQTV